MRIGLGIVLAALTALVAFGIAGCSGGGNATLPDPTVRFVNSSPDSNPLNFFYDDTEKASALAYLDNSVDFTVKQGDHDLSVEDSITSTVMDALAITLNQDTKYLGVAVGLENFGAEQEKRLQLVAFNYDKNSPNGSRARLIIIHGYLRQTGFQTPDIDFQGGAVATYDPNNPQYLVADIAFAANPPSTVEVDSGVPIIFQARRAGTENVYASDPSTTFDAGGIYLALVTGVEGQVGVEVPQIKYIKLN